MFPAPDETLNMLRFYSREEAKPRKQQESFELRQRYCLEWVFWSISLCKPAVWFEWTESQMLFDLKSNSQSKEIRQRQCNQHTHKLLSMSKMSVWCSRMKVTREQHRLRRFQTKQAMKVSRLNHGKLWKTVAMLLIEGPYRIQHEAVHSLPGREGDQRSTAIQGIACSNNFAPRLQSVFFRGLIICLLRKNYHWTGG